MILHLLTTKLIRFKRKYDRDDFLHVSYPHPMITNGRMPSEWFDTVAEEKAAMDADVANGKEKDIIQNQREKINTLADQLRIQQTVFNLDSTNSSRSGQNRQNLQHEN